MTKPVCGSPNPDDPTWTCQRDKDHLPDFHAIGAFSGDVTWPVTPATKKRGFWRQVGDAIGTALGEYLFGGGR